jgi:hypothetical protein
MFENITDVQVKVILFLSILLSIAMSLLSKSNNQSDNSEDSSDNPFPMSESKRSDKVQRKF